MNMSHSTTDGGGWVRGFGTLMKDRLHPEFMLTHCKQRLTPIIMALIRPRESSSKVQ
jgi:hypothetical protein